MKIFEFEISNYSLNTKTYDRCSEMFAKEDAQELIQLQNIVNDIDDEEHKSSNGSHVSKENSKGTSKRTNPTLAKSECVTALCNMNKEYLDKYKLIFIKFFDMGTEQFYTLGDQLVSTDITFDELTSTVKDRHRNFVQTKATEADQSRAENKEESKENLVNHTKENGIENNSESHSRMNINFQALKLEIDSSGDFQVNIFEETATAFPSYGLEIDELNQSEIKEVMIDGNIIIYTVVSQEMSEYIDEVKENQIKAIIDVYIKERNTV